MVTHHHILTRHIKVEVSGERSLTVLDINQAEGPGVRISLEDSNRVVASVTNIEKPEHMVLLANNKIFLPHLPLGCSLISAIVDLPVMFSGTVDTV